LINLYFPGGKSVLRTLIICCALFISREGHSQQLCFPQLTPADDIVVDCGDAIPDFAPCSATTACCGSVEVETFESETGNVLSTCSATTAFGPGPDWAFWLPDVDPQNVEWRFENNGVFEEYADGTALLSGIIFNVANPALRMEANLWMKNRRNWSQWSALGRSYKDDLNLAGNQYQNWDYYELAEGFAWLNGLGQLAGSQLMLSHKPYTYYYGFQTGMAANCKNSNDGLSGWFDYTGYLNGQWVTGHGDVNIDQACTDGPDGCASTAFTRICRATNECPLSSYSSQTIYVQDTTPPVILSHQEEVTQDCFNPVIIEPVAQDNCSSVFITYQDEILEPGCVGSILRHFNVCDGCGNCVSVDQLVELTGGIPEFTDFPDDATFQCGEVPPSDTPMVAYTEGCDNTVLTMTETQVPGTCPGQYTLVRVYTLTDDCDNAVSRTWTLEVIDTLPPTLFNIPADLVLGCGDPIPSDQVFAIDLCTPNVVTSVTAETQQLTCGYLLIRTWWAFDDCGNSASATQTITVTDEQPPVFLFIPENVGFECAADGEIAPAVAADACSPVSLTFQDIPLLTAGCPGSFTRIYTATDGCGLTASASHDVLISDSEQPVFTSFPEDVTVACGDVPSAEDAAVSFSDNCSSVTAEWTETTEDGTCPVAYTVHRTLDHHRRLRQQRPAHVGDYRE
jgi:hypothetical protein